jgi:tape measure domain-containing protein
MADFANLVIGVNTSELKRGERDLQKFGTTAKTMNGAVVSATRALALFGGAFAAVRAVSQASQTFASLANGMRILGFEAEAVAAQINKIGDIAKRTRSPLEATAQLFQRVSIAAKDLGASQQQVLRFTENVGLALAQQGGSAAQASGALLQLSQALSGGTVRAEEFNSILEGAFPIAQAAANAIEGAAGSVGKLRSMVIEGEVSSREFFNAILSSSEALEAAFGNTVPTVSQALTVLSTSFTLFVGQADSFLGASSALANLIIFLSGNLEYLAGVVSVAAVAFGVRYVAAMVTARLATFSLIGALQGLKAALISTGIGVVIVGLGLVVGQLIKARSQTESFGDTFRMVALQVKAASLNMKAYFISALGGMAYEFIEFTYVVADGLNSIFGTNLMGASAEITQNLNKAFLETEAAAAAATAAANALKISIAETSDESDGASLALDKLGGSAKDAAKAAKEAAEAAKKLADEIQALEFDADPLKKYNFELANLNRLSAAGLSDGAYAKAVQDLNDGLAESYPLVGKVSDAFGDFVAGGLQDFKGFVSTILGSFKSMLSQMIATAARNKIMISMGLGGSAMGTVASAAPVGGVGAIGGALGGIGASFMSGASGLLTGGISGATAAISGATGALGGLAAAAGAIALPVLAVVGIFAAFKKKTELLDSGLKVTVNGFNAAIESFSKTKSSRFFGLFSSTSSNTTQLSAAQASPITGAIGSIQQSVLSAAAGLGIGADAFSKFSYKFNLSLKGMTEEQKMSAVSAELAKMGDAFASVIPGITSLNELLAASAERYNLQNRLLELQGKGEELLARQRAALMAATNDLNKSILQQIFVLEDAAAAQAKANEAAQAAAQKAAGIAKERFGLTNRLLELQGKDAELLKRIRAEEVRAADASNRSILRQIYALEDLAKASEDAAAAARVLFNAVDENNFATGADFRRGLSRASNGIEYTPQQSQAEMLMELKALNARIDMLQSTSEITANSSTQTADNTDFRNSLLLGV